jgi:hypothetical protein
MQHLVAALFGTSSDATTINPDTREYIANLMNRAHMNLHGISLNNAEHSWSNAMITAGIQLYKDARVYNLSSREIVQLFENVIRVSEEHLKISRRSASMAVNVFYLKETALDNAITDHHIAEQSQAAHPTVHRANVAHSGRISHKPLPQTQD